VFDWPEENNEFRTITAVTKDVVCFIGLN